jgi:hypothetical protein
MVNKPTGIFINFAQYLDWSIYQESNYDEFVRGYLTFGTDVDPYISVVNLPTAVQKFIDCVERETGVPVIGIGTGARVQDVIFFNEAYDLFRYAYHGDRIENT